MMRSRRYRVIITLFALAIFWPIAFLLPRPYLFDVMNALGVSVGLGVLGTYSGAALQGFRDETCTPGHLLVVGIVLAWFAVVIRLVVSWAWRLFDYPPALAEHVLLAFAVWLFFLGGVLHLTARNAVGDRIPRGNWIILGLSVTVGTLLGIILIFWVGH